ncbi:MAG: DNA-processing protein DprA [Micavibrio sp.]
MAWLRLLRTENVGPITFHRLIQRYQTASKALDALPHLAARGGRTKPLVAPPLAAVEKEYEALQKFGASLICAAEPDYPLPLGAVEDAPPVLTIIGNAKLLNKACVGVVGARNASLNGRKFAEILARDLGQAGQVIASGLARGIDTAAHQGSLPTGTIAVVAGGIDVIYPPENKNLYAQIREQGLIVAESPFGQEPFAQSFPRRNRIISGLSQGVVVVEASLRSGSLITARMAAEQGRDVFAVPGHPLDPRAAGTNSLIRDGAILVREAQDILSDLGQFSANGLRDVEFHPYEPEEDTPENIPANDTLDLSETILGHLSATPVQVDDLIQACGGYTAAVSGNLLMLELAGQVQRLPGNRVVRINRA